MQPVVRHYVEIMEDRARTLEELAVVLREVGSAHALVGGLAVGYHGRERATVDVDLLVPKAKLARICEALESRGYGLTIAEDMVRVFAPGANPNSQEAIADLVARDASPVLRAAFAEVEDARVLGTPVSIVKRGALVALKFHAAVSLARRIADRYQDVADIGRVVDRSFTPDDAALARRIAALSYPGAERDLDEMIENLRAGRPVKL